MKKAWVVSVDMGYGHQRAAYPLKDIAYERIITANSDKFLTEKEKNAWRKTQAFYESISRLVSLPIIGKRIFRLYDKFQSIDEFYPYRDLSKPNIATLYFDKLIRKGLNKSLMMHLKRNELPIVATHFVPALAADYNGIKKVYCVVTDTDINRAWLAKDPAKSKIIYLAPCQHTVKRLRQYGVPDNRIIMTGFPLPKENVGGANLHIIKRDLGRRLPNLDPRRTYLRRYEKVIKAKLGRYYKKKSKHKLTITFMIGGAGAQREIGLKMLKSLKKRVLDNKIVINFSAGTRLDVAEYYRQNIIQLGLEKCLGRNLSIIFAWNKPSYFQTLNNVLHNTDILWSKPSELSFYAALGLPIIISPPIGAHEYYNQKWLMEMGTGFPQENADFTAEWLDDWLERGILAEAAFEGFMEAPKLGTYNIERVVCEGKPPIMK